MNSPDEELLGTKLNYEEERAQRLPVFGINKMKNMQDLSTDLFHSMLSYAAMATSYQCLDNVVDGDGKIPDSLFADAEEELMTCILSYEAYSYDDSVNIDNINMKHFFIYDEKNDKYYIILYVIDQARVSRQMIQDMNDNIDVVEFMLGQN
jgi:hypothetical protein